MGKNGVGGEGEGEPIYSIKEEHWKTAESPSSDLFTQTVNVWWLYPEVIVF